MSFDWQSWLTLIARWVHIFASILWVGTTYYFTWLDGRFSERAVSGSLRRWWSCSPRGGS